MSRLIEKQKALELRKLGKSYSQIRKEIGVSKSTLSEWLRNIPLSKEQVRLLRDINEKRIEAYRKTMKKKRERRIQMMRKDIETNWDSLSNRELRIAGLFLYWGEGNKSMFSSVSLSNNDPDMLLFFKIWLLKVFKVKKEKFKVYLHLYKDMNIEFEMNRWSKILSIPLIQFARPYIKESNLSQLTHRGFGHGTCNLTINDIRLKENIMIELATIAKMVVKISPTFDII